jgi:hypothetical protein
MTLRHEPSGGPPPILFTMWSTQDTHSNSLAKAVKTVAILLTFSRRFKSDPESYSMIFKMFMVQFIIMHNVKNQENRNSPRMRKPVMPIWDDIDFGII